MKRIIYIFLIIIIVACDSENANDCFQRAGDIIQQEVIVDPFNKIFINRNIELIIKEGPIQEVVIETGKNLLNDVIAMVVDGKLTLTDNNTCNYVRDYESTKVYVTSPNITEIRSSTQYDISSDGVLTYPSLTILSEDFGDPSTITIANFRLQIDNNTFRAVFNNISNCFISGKTENLSLIFASGISRFEGRDLIAQKVDLWNRGSNDMIVNPQQEIKGTISGVGDVISVNRPPIVEVDQLYTGRLIFE
ncbi:head GIN domain-containing protein [Flavivirga amylovorans]|uniref:Head GIN domain-containing protein n=1 Tax=Flavivirga amylovorans TaxID=870486 RepID=A0ABT8X128_9FLAO|nr:head GIN domain-containing protein [Flavivirga amylovorans]MDO5987427.1 head GIN domain-containing protein [Flavivirga amylovorans]